MLSLSNRFLKHPSYNLINHPLYNHQLNNHNLKDYIRKIERDLKTKNSLKIDNINPNHCSLHVLSVSILIFLAGYYYIKQGGYVLSKV
jgi:hypothetical protein